MRLLRGWVAATLTTLVSGCATTGTPPVGAFVTKCKDIDLTAVSLEPTPPGAWDPKPLAPGFLRIDYRWEANAGPVYAIGILYENLDTQRVAFVVGPLPGFPDHGPGDPAAIRAPANVEDEWMQFFKKVRGATQFDRPGGFFCAGKPCAMPPDSPPPEFLGVASSGSSGGIAAVFGTPRELFAQLMRVRPVVSDAVFNASGKTASEERQKIVRDLARKTCHGVQAQLGNE